MSRPSLAFLFTLVLSPAVVAGPFDWPQWRGPHRDGISAETGLLRQWPESGPPVAWQAKNLGGGYSTPSVAGGRVFGMSYRGNDEVVWAVDERTGKELWARPIAPKGKAGYNEGSRSTPTVDGNLVYALGVSGDLVCLRAAKGEVVWKRNLPKDFDGRMMSNWGYSESVLVDGDRVICTPGSDKAALAALDKKTGRTVWTAEVPKAGGAGYASIIPAELGKVKMYVTLLGKTGGVVGVRARDGKLLWQYTHVVNNVANIPTPIYRDGYLAVSTGYTDGGYAVLRLTADGDKVHADEVNYHPSRELQNHHGGMVLVGDHVYLGRAHKNGFPTCVKFKTGEIAWEEQRGPGAGSAAVSYADGMLYFRYEDGLMALVEASPKGYNLVSKFKLPEPSGKPSWPHPVIANGKLFIRDQDRLTSFDIKATQ